MISEIRAVYEIMWKNMEQLDRPQIKTIRRMGFVCWVTKATATYSEYVIYIAFNSNNGYRNVPQRYVVRTVSACPVSFLFHNSWNQTNVLH
jgi:hypothetical protein